MSAAVPTATPELDASRHGRITENNHGPYVVVATYIMMCMMLLLVLTRLITKYITIRSLRLDDFSIVAAAVRRTSSKKLQWYTDDWLSVGVCRDTEHFGPTSCKQRSRPAQGCSDRCAVRCLQQGLQVHEVAF